MSDTGNHIHFFECMYFLLVSNNLVWNFSYGFQILFSILHTFMVCARVKARYWVSGQMFNPELSINQEL